MDDANTITIDHLTKTYGATHAVDGLSFEVRPGQVTGFLGPNGSGTVTINGRSFADLRRPLHEVGALLIAARAFHPDRSARNHLRCLAQSNHIPDRRVDEVLDQVGLSSVAGFISAHSLGRIVVRTPERARLTELMTRAGGACDVDPDSTEAVTVSGLTAPEVGHLAADHSIPLYALGLQEASLEEAFMELTHDSVEYRAGDTPAPSAVAHA